MKIKKSAQEKLKDNIRFQALQILEQIFVQGAYSNVVLNRYLSQHTLSGPDKQLLVQLVYGVIQHWKTLEYYLSTYIKGKKIDDWVRILLVLSVFQMEYLDRIPAHAVVNEAVKIGKTLGHQGLANFINAILRNYQRKGKTSLAGLDKEQSLAIQYSVDQSIINQLEALLEPAALEDLLASLLVPARLSVRINPKKTDRQQVIDQLEQEGIQSQISQVSPYGLHILQGDIFASQAFQAGWLTVQDESSMLVGPLGQLKGNELVLDPCSAPGGKATHVTSLLDDGHVTALDISPHKLNLVKEHAIRLGLDNIIDYQVADAEKFYPPEGLIYDRIYLDAPCSGLGLMRRKPEIKYHQIDAIIANLTEIQRNLINHLSQFLKPGGILIYSTCTLTRAENEEMVEAFLASHPNFDILPIQNEEVLNPRLITSQGFIRVWPHVCLTDGFFIARLIKKD